MREFWTAMLGVVALLATSASLAGPATHLTLTVPSNVTSGATLNVTVKALDSSNKQDTSYAGTVHFTSSDANALLSDDLILFLGNATVHPTLITVGSQSISVADTVTSSISGTSTPINVTANNNPAAHFIVTVPSTAKVGVPFAVTVKAVDQSTRIVSSYTGTVHFASTDPAAVLPADVPLTLGVGKFPVTLMTIGAWNIKATDVGSPSIAGTSPGLVTSAGPATHFRLTTPTDVSIYTSFEFSVSARDAGGNVDPTYAGQVHATSTDGTALLPPDLTLSNGSGSFAITFQSAGSYTVTVNDTATSAIAGTSQPIASHPLADGSYDPTFASGGRRMLTLFPNMDASRILAALRPDGRVLLAGAGCGAFTLCVLQLTADGKSYDPTFGPGGSGYVTLSSLTGFSACSNGIALLHLLQDGRILIVGRSCDDHVLIAVLKADGTDLDRSLAGGAGWLLDDAVFYEVSSAAIQSDGKILVAGQTPEPTDNNNDNMAVGRWMSDLSGRDETFAASSPVPGIRYIAFGLEAPGSPDVAGADSVALLPDGRILLGGSTSAGDVRVTPNAYLPAFVRLLNDGSLDLGFGPDGTGRTHVDWPLSDCIQQVPMVVDSYGRAVFSCSGNLGRIDASGNLDPTFNGSGMQPLSVMVTGLALQPDGKIIAISGDLFFAPAMAGITRLREDGTLDSTFGTGGTVQRTFYDASLGCCAATSLPWDVIFAGQRGLLVSGAGRVDVGDDFQFGVMQLTIDVIFGDGFGD